MRFGTDERPEAGVRLALPERWDRVSFVVSGASFTWRDVVVDARRRGEWDAVEAEIRLGVDCLRRASEVGPGRTEGEVHDALTTFRSERKLFAAEEFEGWLEARDLSLGEVIAWIRRELARVSWSPSGFAEDTVVADEEVAAVAWVTGVCAGHLERLAYELAGRVAVDRHVVEQGVELERDDAYDRFCREVVGERELERVIATRLLDWMIVDAEWLSFADEDIAREAVLCLREDRWSLSEVMQATACVARRRRFLVEELDPGLRHRFHAARAQDLVGPLPDAGAHAVALVLDKSPPSLRDQLVRRRAQAAVVASAVDEQIERRVRWVDHF